LAPDFGGVAQWSERRAFNPSVEGSIPSTPTEELAIAALTLPPRGRKVEGQSGNAGTIPGIGAQTMPTRTTSERRGSGNAGDLRVLVVEDNDMITRLVTHMLEGEAGITMTLGGSDVTSLMSEPTWYDVDVALVDLLLPGAVGDDLLNWLAVHAPHVRRVAMSGAGPLRLSQAEAAHVQLSKPFMLDDLLAALRA
jgi:CheY-like chemotaxis protein